MKKILPLIICIISVTAIIGCGSGKKTTPAQQQLIIQDVKWTGDSKYINYTGFMKKTSTDRTINNIVLKFEYYNDKQEIIDQQDLMQFGSIEPGTQKKFDGTVRRAAGVKGAKVRVLRCQYK